jgi:uncharacterized membrane protein
MKVIARTFDEIGYAFTSMGAVVFILLMIIIAKTFFTHTLFLQVFPDTMSYWEKHIGSWVMAIAWDSTVLITTCNPKHVDKRIPMVMAVAEGVIMLFFIEAFDLSFTGLQIVMRWFIGILVAFLTYIYSDLFYGKWLERTNALQQPDQLQQLRAKLEQVEANLEHTAAGLEQSEAKVKQYAATIRDYEAEIKDLTAFREKVEAELKCPHCEKIQLGYGTLRTHQGHCPKNPKNINKPSQQ